MEGRWHFGGGPPAWLGEGAAGACVLHCIRVLLAHESVGREATYTWERIQKNSTEQPHMTKCTAAIGKMLFKVHFGYSCVVGESMQRLHCVHESART